jgi:hypothetical protein
MTVVISFHMTYGLRTTANERYELITLHFLPDNRDGGKPIVKEAIETKQSVVTRDWLLRRRSECLTAVAADISLFWFVRPCKLSACARVHVRTLQNVRVFMLHSAVPPVHQVFMLHSAVPLVHQVFVL